MEEKNNKGIIALLIIIIVILLVLVVLLATDTINFKSVNNGNNQINENIDNDVLDNTDNDNETTDETTETDNKLLKIAQEKMLTMIKIAHSYNYCGETDKNDYIERYIASKTFKSIDALSVFASNFMLYDLQQKYLNTSNSDMYLEKDNKLYCASANKDCGYNFLYDNNDLNNKANYNITEQSSNQFKVTVTVPYTVGCDPDNILTLTANATFVAKSENWWLISEYNDNAIYDVKY